MGDGDIEGIINYKQSDIKSSKYCKLANTLMGIEQIVYDINFDNFEKVV